jgi:hypothetical protein
MEFDTTTTIILTLDHAGLGLIACFLTLHLQQYVSSFLQTSKAFSSQWLTSLCLLYYSVYLQSVCPLVLFKFHR